MCTRSAPATASPGVAATVAPKTCSARAFASVRFHTVTASPRRSMPSTIAPPSKPVPRNATLAIADLPVESTPVRHSAARAGWPVIGFVLLALFLGMGPGQAGHYLAGIGATALAQPSVLRWAGDPEGGAPFVEAQ